MKTAFRALSLVSALTLAFLAAPLPVSAQKEEKTVKLTCTTADEWSALFDRRNEKRTWLGADGIYSVAIDGNDAFGSATKSTKTFFIFSDSLMGTADEDGNVTWAPGQPSQTSAVLTGNKPDKENIRFVWGNGGSLAFGGDEHLFGEHKWMLDCFSQNGDIYIFGFPEEAWKPAQIDMIKIPVKDGEPDYANYSKTADIKELWYKDDRKLFAYGVGVMSNTEEAGAPNPDGYLYLYGYLDNISSMSRKDMICARVKASEFPDFSGTTYWDGNEWTTDITKSKALIKNVSCEFSVTPITTGPYKVKYIAVYTEATESSLMMYAIGESPVGPFGKSVCFYQAPEHGQDNGGMYTYNAKAHPHLSSDGKLLVSYNCNNRNHFGGQTSVEYHPRFLWLDLDPEGMDRGVKGFLKKPYVWIAAGAVLVAGAALGCVFAVKKKKK